MEVNVPAPVLDEEANAPATRARAAIAPTTAASRDVPLAMPGAAATASALGTPLIDIGPLTVAWAPAAPGSADGGARLLVVEAPASRADAVLAAAMDPLLADVTLSPMLQLLRSEDVLRRLEEVQQQLAAQGEQRDAVVASTIALTGGLSIGYVVWLVRGGVLVSSMLSALPAWQMIDPLPVMASAGAAGTRRRRDSAGDADVERLFDRPRHARPPAAAAGAPVPAAPVPAAPAPASAALTMETPR